MNNTQIIRICKAGERAVVLFAVLLLGIANNGLAQSTVQENIAISTYYPSPEVLAVYDLEVAHNMTVSNRLDIRSGGGNFLHGGSSPIEFSMRTNAINTDLRVRFNSDTFVGDTRTYVCPAGQTSCRGSTETRLYFNDYDQNDRSMELNGLVLTDWPELSRARIDIQNPLFLLPRPPEHDHDFTEEQDLCFRQFPNDTVALERCLAHTVRIPALNEFNSRRVKKMMQGFTRTSGWWFGFGIGIAEAVHVGFGMEFIPPFYIHQYKEMTYEVDPCYYPGTAIEDQCPGGRLIGE